MTKEKHKTKNTLYLTLLLKDTGVPLRLTSKVNKMISPR